MGGVPSTCSWTAGATPHRARLVPLTCPAVKHKAAEATWGGQVGAAQSVGPCIQTKSRTLTIQQ